MILIGMECERIKTGTQLSFEKDTGLGSQINIGVSSNRKEFERNAIGDFKPYSKLAAQEYVGKGINLVALW